LRIASGRRSWRVATVASCRCVDMSAQGSYAGAGIWLEGGSVTPLGTADLAHTLIALAAILLSAHGMGSLFVRFRQPRAVGEILGGLLLGATVLGWVWPSAQGWVFPTDGSTPVVLGAVYQLGLLLLLFIAGSELRTVFHRGERRTVVAVFALSPLMITCTVAS